MADTDYMFLSDGGQNYHAPLQDVGGGLYSPFPLNPATRAIITLSHELHELHSGNHYTLAGTTTLDSASSDLLDFSIVTPNTTTWAHMTFMVSSVGQTTYTIYEGVTHDSDGTAASAFNNNRNSANATALTITTNPANFTPAASDIIFQQVIGADGGGALIRGGNMDRHGEFILKQNTSYIFRLDSQSASNLISYYADWYEDADKA